MSTFTKLVGAVTTGVGALTTGALQYAKKNFGPTEGSAYKPMDKYVYKEEEHVVIGWTGHHKATFEKDMTEKDLYVGDKTIAQLYAQLNGGKYTGDGRVGLVIAKKQPAEGMPRFEGPHAPLLGGSGPGSMKESGTKIVEIEPVTPQSDTRAMAAVQRMYNQLYGDKSKKEDA